MTRQKFTLSLCILISSIIVLLLIGGCKKDENNPADAGNTQASQIAITIGSGTKPQYSWSGGNVFSLSIVRTTNQTVVVWGLATPGQNGIASPVTNGTTPAGSVETAVTERTLTVGVQYRISISRLDGTTGFKEFTQ
ncbi:MAG: hypothetical protein V1799_14870 [bacterium]